MGTKRVTKIGESLNKLTKKDVYSLVLFTLFKLKDKKEYSTLSELSYILDNDNLSKFLRYFGGMTITVPTLRELKLITQALLLYQFVNIDECDFSAALKKVCGDEFNNTEMKNTYSNLLEVIKDYEFGREPKDE